MLVSNLCMQWQQRKTYGKCVTQICKKSRNNFIVKYGTRHIFCGPVEHISTKWNLEINWSLTSRTRKCCLTILLVSVRLWCCRLLVDEVHYYSLSLYSFDSCLFYGFPVVWGSVFSLYVYVDDGLFHFRLGPRAFSVVRILYIYKIKAKQLPVTLVYASKL